MPQRMQIENVDQNKNIGESITRSFWSILIPLLRSICASCSEYRCSLAAMWSGDSSFCVSTNNCNKNDIPCRLNYVQLSFYDIVTTIIKACI